MKAKQPIRSQTTEMKIGKVTYIVTTHFNEKGRETAVDKMARLVSGRIADALKTP